MSQIYRWRSAAGGGLEHCVLQAGPAGLHAHSVVIHADGFAIAYDVECDSDWRIRRASVGVVGGRKIELAFQPPGGWLLDGEAAETLSDATEIDILVTPFTNTLPIRRCRLAIGESATIVTAWVDCPSLDVFADPQRYTRLEANLYRFEGLDSGFTRDIAVDADGFVVDYPDLFSRVA